MPNHNYKVRLEQEETHIQKAAVLQRSSSEYLTSDKIYKDTTDSSAHMKRINVIGNVMVQFIELKPHSILDIHQGSITVGKACFGKSVKVYFDEKQNAYELTKNITIKNIDDSPIKIISQTSLSSQSSESVQSDEQVIVVEDLIKLLKKIDLLQDLPPKIIEKYISNASAAIKKMFTDYLLDNNKSPLEDKVLVITSEIMADEASRDCSVDDLMIELGLGHLLELIKAAGYDLPYDLPRDIVKHIFSFLELTDIMTIIKATETEYETEQPTIAEDSIVATHEAALSGQMAEFTE